ncbi:hypothetical protein [Ruegeria sp.]|uniref:hypothetical protein n=1 Tax=Ruegeria sp. TaxID=1879320 RepID=UPI00231A081E|nr:hypothetical protein [Ruegeria sp.]MDA7964976.1 hypothetical protein [Ruegeria sp.]
MAFKADISARDAISAPFGGGGGVCLVTLTAAIAAVSVVCFTAIWPLRAMALSHEGGPIETIAAVALLVAGLIALKRYTGITRLYIAVVCLLLTERELEAQVYPEGSPGFMILSGLDDVLDVTAVRVVLAVIVFGGLIWHGVPNGLRAFRQREPFLMIFLLAGACAVTAQVLEEFSSAYATSLSTMMWARLFALEETLEMFFSVGILASVLIGWSKPGIEETVNDITPRPDPR